MNVFCSQRMSVIFDSVLFTSFKVTNNDNLGLNRCKNPTDNRINPANITILVLYAISTTPQMFLTTQPPRSEVIIQILLIVFADKCLQ